MGTQNHPGYVLLTEPPKEKIAVFPREHFRYKFVNGQRFILLPQAIEKRKFRHFTINFGLRSLRIRTPSDFLTSAEMDDVEISLKELKEGRIRKFKNTDVFLQELKK